jgi:predicted transcriptional regulator
MPQSKISGKFYPLQHEELIELNKSLTGSELSVYLWLKTNDPFGERLVEADTKVIAEELNLSRRSVQRALAKLQKEKLIDLVITKFFYRVKSKPTEEDNTDKVKEKLRVTTSVSPDDISVANSTRMSSSVRECREQYVNVVIKG